MNPTTSPRSKTRLRWGRVLFVLLAGAGLTYALPRAPGYVERWQASQAESRRQTVSDELVRLRQLVDLYAKDAGRLPRT